MLVTGSFVQCESDEPAAEQSWSSANLVQFELDEPSWIWTQSIPNYSLNWTKGPVLYDGDNNTARSLQGGPTEVEA